MNKEVDARGQTCPKPVIMTKKALEEIKTGTITTIVDNEVAKENVSRLSKSSNYDCEVEKIGDNQFYIHITKGEGHVEDAQIACAPNTFKDMTMVFSNDKMGKGSDELGEILMKGFLYTLTEGVPLPATLIFLNSGVYLTTEGSKVIEDLEKLESEGVEILSCGTCLDYYGIKDQLRVGEISNMYTIAEKMKNATNTITL